MLWCSMLLLLSFHLQPNCRIQMLKSKFQHLLTAFCFIPRIFPNFSCDIVGLAIDIPTISTPFTVHLSITNNASFRYRFISVSKPAQGVLSARFCFSFFNNSNFSPEWIKAVPLLSVIFLLHS